MNIRPYDEIRKKLTDVYKEEGRLSSLVNFIKILTAGLSLFFFLILVENFFYLSSPVKTALAYSLILFSFSASVVFVLIPLVKSYREPKIDIIYKIAARVGEDHPSIKDNLLNALQLVNENNSLYSEELINAAFKNVYDASINLSFSNNTPRQLLNLILKRLGIVLVPLYALFLIMPGFGDSLSRLINYDIDYSTPPRIVFEVMPGNKNITKGEALKIKILVSGLRDSDPNIYIRNIEQANFSEKRLLADSIDSYSYLIRSVNNSFYYYAECEGYKSEEYFIDITNRPIVKNLKVTIIPPSYSKLEKIIQIDNGNITALKGSRIEIELSSSKALNQSVIHMGEVVTDMTVSANRATVLFINFNSGKYFFELTDTEGNKSINPVEYNIYAQVDSYPDIEIQSPGDRLRITSEIIATESLIRDDYGFSAYKLNYRISQSKYITPPESFSQKDIPFKPTLLEQEIYYAWSISDLLLTEGDVVTYFFEVFDNDVVSGPKSFKTPFRTILVPGIDEYFKEADKIQDEAKDDLKETLKEASKLNADLEKLSNELKRDEKELSYEEKKNIENALNRFEEMSKKVSEVADKLNEMQKDLTQNNLLSAETMEKYSQLQQLMKELEGSEALEALRKMQNELDNMLRNNAQQNLDQLKANENSFKESLERTLNLLKRLQVEQKVDEMIKRTEKISEKTQKLNEEVEKKKTGDNSLENRSEDLKDNLSGYEKAMEDLKEKMKELSNMPLDEMKKVESELSEQKNNELSEQISEDIKSGKMNAAKQNMNQMQSNMGKISQMLKTMQEHMNNSLQMEMFYDMAKIINDLIYLSKEEEKLSGSAENQRGNSEALNKLAAEQNNLSGALNRIMENVAGLSQKSFAVTPEMGKALGSAKWNMQQSQTFLQQPGGNQAASRMGKEAMMNLNQAALLMNGAMKDMMSGGQGSGGMMSMMQKLQEMYSQQLDINEMSKMIQQQRMAQAQMAQMQRLAQEQEMIRKSLEELQREAVESGQSKKIASNLEKVLKEMQEAVNKMSSNTYDDNLIQKQENILSRLLDAQRSINSRDFEDQRESFAGKNINKNSASNLLLNKNASTDLIKEELLKALREGYKKDYEELIRRYFEAIEKEIKK